MIPVKKPTGQENIGIVRIPAGITNLACEVKMMSYVMSEADINLRPLDTSIFDIYKGFESLLCCLKGIWVHLHTVTLAKLAPDLGIQGHLWSDNDAIMSWLRLISTSSCIIQP